MVIQYLVGVIGAFGNGKRDVLNMPPNLNVKVLLWK
jgi:hypothetical protein